MIKLKLLLEGELEDSEQWEDWYDYIDYFVYDIEKEELLKLIKKYDLAGKKYLSGKVLNLWDKKHNIYVEYDKDAETVSLIKDIDQWIYDKGEASLDIDPSKIYNPWIESTLECLQENPGKVYHYTTEEKFEEIQKQGVVIGSGGTGLTNRYSRGIFTSTNSEEYALGTYGNICLELDLNRFMKESNLKKLNLDFEPDIMEYLIRTHIRSSLNRETGQDEMPSDMSPYTVIVEHSIPIKYVKQI